MAVAAVSAASAATRYDRRAPPGPWSRDIRRRPRRRAPKRAPAVTAVTALAPNLRPQDSGVKILRGVEHLPPPPPPNALRRDPPAAPLRAVPNLSCMAMPAGLGHAPHVFPAPNNLPATVRGVVRLASGGGGEDHGGSYG